MDINEVLCNNKQKYFSEVIENFNESDKEQIALELENINFDECMNYLKEKDIDKSDEQTQKEWEEDVTSFLALHNTLLNSLKRIDTDVMTKYAKELQSNAKEYEKAGLKPNVFDSIEAFEKMYLG